MSRSLIPYLLGIIVIIYDVSSNVLRQSQSTSEAPRQLAPSCPYIISRAEWGAKDANPPLEPLTETPGHVYIHHGATPPDGCHSEGLCKAMVRAYQDFHQISRGWSDIAYSFLVGEDGMAYEGRGWTNVGAHTKGHNRDGLGFCVIGDFTHRVPNAAALDTLRALIQCGVDSGYITPDYIMLGHRDTAPNHTACPGDSFYPVIQTWPHYNSTS